MAGRRPKLEIVKELAGNPGRRPARSPGPSFPLGVGDPPDYLVAAARREWDRVAPGLESRRIVTSMDRATLIGYCVAFADWEEAAQKLAETGQLVASARGDAIPNPWMERKLAAEKSFLRFAMELGMTPATRSKVGAAPAPPAENAASKFFGPRPVAG